MTPDDGIAVSLPGLDRGAAGLDEALKQLVGSLEELYPRVVAVGRHWEGEARDAFVGLMADWEKQMRDLQERQRWLHHVVVNGHGNFSAAHQAVLRGWGAA